MPGVKHKSIDDKGFAALIIAIILVMVVSLTTVGFAELMRKEQRIATDRHLSSQAYYAAESGVSDAAKAVNDGYDKQKTTCGPYTAALNGTPEYKYLSNSTVGTASANVSWSCLLINPEPKTLEYTAIDDTESKITEITGVDPADPNTTVPIKYLNIGWQGTGGTQTFNTTGNHNFTPAASWPGSTGVLRIGLTPLASGFINRAALVDGTYTAFLFPNGSGPGGAPSYSYGSGSDSGGTAPGVIVDGNCNASNSPEPCNVSITNLGQASYLLDMRSIYGKSRVTITAYGYTNTQLAIKNAQTLVDATGKSQDILRRVQVRIPSHNNYPHSDYGTSAMNGICKQLQVTPDTGNRACDPTAP